MTMTSNETTTKEDNDAKAEVLAVKNEDADAEAEGKGIIERIDSRIVGYHFSGLSFRPGRDGVRSVLVGDPGVPGAVSVKVVYSGTGKRNSIFTVPIQLVVIEEEELPIAVVAH